jgi:hypothetical protein
MTVLTVTFLSIGGFALLLLLLSLLGGHVHLGHLHLGHGHAAGHGLGVELSLPVIAGFLGMFGFGGAIVGFLLGGAGTTATLGAIGAGLVTAIPTAWLAGVFVDAAVNMPTDVTLTSNHLIGAPGVITMPVPAGGYGEVRLRVAGQLMKFNARADAPLAAGTTVFVIEVPSPSSVLVEPTPGLSR